MGRTYKFAQISSIFSLSVKIMPPLTAFYCDTIETAVDQSGRRDSAIPLQAGRLELD
jgi:hypothetical protein